MLRLSLFGGFTLLGADLAPVVIASRKGRALLAYLALQPRPSARERLAGLLWGDGGEARARGSLRQALTTLRQEIPGGDDWLAATGETVAIERGAFWVDALAAQERLEAGDLSAALELCARGELMAGLNPGAAEFDDWREAEQRRWRERETAALAACAERAREKGEHRQLLVLGRRLLKLEPWNEEAHRQVMAALAALGRRSEALRQYQIASEVLRAELGVAPDPRTEKLLLEIRSERTAPAAAPRDGNGGQTGTGTRELEGPVGRGLEGLQIEGLLRGCKASGRGHVILVRGEAGMGKTTLLRQALEHARGLGFATYLVEASDSGAGRNTEVLRGALAALDVGEAPAAHRLAIAELLGGALDAADAALAAALDLDARRAAHVRAVEALVAAAGARQPRVIAIEDLHWCDAETARLLCALAATAPQHRAVVMFTCRTGEEPAELAWSALLRRGSLTSIDLGPLAPEDAARLAARYAQRDPEVARRCLERAGGHPLYLVQLLESAAAGDEIPESLQAAVLARLARVAPAERRLLEGVAVVAAPLALGQITSLLEEPGAAVVDRLVQRGWLELDGARVTIAHDLLGAAIRGSLPAPALAQLHRWAAACFAGVDPLRSAEHLDQAGDPGAALAYLSVAREAVGERRFDLAERVLARIDGFAAEADVAFAALCLRGDVRRERADPAGSHGVFARALAQAHTPAQQTQARLGMAAALRLLDRHHEALACLDQAEALTPAADHASRAKIDQLRGNLLFTLGNLPGCRGAHQRALAHAQRADSAADEVAAQSGLGDAYYLEGRLASASRAFESCRELARAHGILRMEAASCLMLGVTWCYSNQLFSAIASAERGVELASQIADARLEALAASVLCIVLLEHADFARALAQGEATQAAARRLGSERLEAMGLEATARVLLVEGRRREALRLSRQALTLSRRSGGLQLSGPSILAVLAACDPDPAAAQAAIAEGEALLAGGAPCHAHFDLRETAMALALARGAWDEVHRHAAALEAYVGAESSARASNVCAQARLLATLAADPGAVAARQRLDQLRADARGAGLALLARWPANLPPGAFTLV